MKKVIFLLLLLGLNTKAFADNGSTSVQTSTTSISNSEGTTHTQVNVNDNGTVTNYSSDQGGSVDVKSVNGQSSITVNGETVSPTTYIKPPATPSISPSPKNSNHPNLIKAKLKMNLFDFLKKIFSFL